MSEKHNLKLSKNIAAAVALVLVLAVLAGVFVACDFGSTSLSGKTRTVVDTAGRTVEVPADPQMICTLSSFAGPLACLYGYADIMMATCNNVLRSNFLKELCPALKNAINVKDSGTMNAESILALGVDLIFIDNTMYSDADERQKLKTMGIPYVVVDFTDMESQMEAALVVGRALGCEEKAEAYVNYYKEAISTVAATLAANPDRKVYDVYHSVNEITRTDAAGSIGAEWTAAAGANNVSIDASLTVIGDKTSASVEQILAWDPEVIICNEAGVDDSIMADSRFAGVDAVVNGKVYQIPVGVTRYGHPNSIETPLAIYWLAKTLYPDYFDYTVEEKIKDFYLTFFGYEASDETLQAIIAGDGIRTDKNK